MFGSGPRASWLGLVLLWAVGCGSQPVDLGGHRKPAAPDPLAATGDDSRLSDLVVDPDSLKLPERPRPLLELGDRFLAPGAISQGFTLPTGAVWQPSLLVFGTYRTAVNAVRDREGEERVEWVNRLDLFAELKLTASERLVVGVSPLDDGRDFFGYRFHPDSELTDEGFDDPLTALFFEGDLGELFPALDPGDRGLLDIGFSVGRQRVRFQDGMLIDDTVDAVGLTRNNLQFPGVANLRLTGLYAWNEVHRGDNRRAGGTQLLGLLTQWDLAPATVDLDLVFSISDAGSGLHGGLSATARLGPINATGRLLFSGPLGRQTDANSYGLLLTGELSYVPHGTQDNLYLNMFVGIERYRAAARSAGLGGPLGPIGILFAGSGLGGFGATLSNQPDRAFGGALGYQKIFSDLRKQVTVEVGGRFSTDASEGAVGVGVRYQQALGKRYLLIGDVAGALSEGGSPSGGARIEFQIRF